jgi:hypothetical protein
MRSKTARGRYEKQTCVARTSEGPLCAKSGQSKFLLEAPGADIFSSPDMPFSDDPAALDLSVGAARG